jgi:hypothetical protein
VHPHLASVLAALDDSRRALEQAAEAVDPAKRAVRPAPERWSLSEVLEHLSLAEASFTGWITTGLDNARAGGLGPEAAERSSLPEAVRARLADRVNRRVAPDRVQPKGEMSAEDAWNAFVEVERRLKEVLIAADGLALNDVIVEHPSLGPFNIYQWVELLAAHRRRHVEQVREIGAALHGPKGAGGIP